jgi:REP element-mobilizing transposase RayT
LGSIQASLRPEADWRQWNWHWGQFLLLTTRGRAESLDRMARKLRLEYPGAIYHVMSRGDRREPICKDDADRRRFVVTLGETSAKTGWQAYAYCLMPNHFHLVVETPQPNLVAGMKWFLGTYTMRFNRRHQLAGHLFSGRYKSLIVDGSGSGYLRAVCDYVHLNPSRAGLVRPDKPLHTYLWSSWPAYLADPAQRPAWLRVDRVLGESGIPKDSAAGRRQLEARLEDRRRAEQDEDYQGIRGGWCLGTEAFRGELLAQMSERVGAEHYGGERGETQEKAAERIIAEELQRRRWGEEELKRRRKGDGEKVKIAQRLRLETMMTVEWVAERLSLGSRAYANHLLWRARQSTD